MQRNVFISLINQDLVISILNSIILIVLLFSSTSSYGDSANCFYINKIIIDRANLSNRSVVDKSFIKQIKSQYENRCLGVDEIKSLVSNITNFYVKKGYITTRVSIPDQDLKNQELNIKIEEGYVEKVESSLQNYPNIFPFIRNKVLNLRDIEQGIDQFSRLRSNNAHVYIKPGNKADHSIIVVENKPSKRWRVVLGSNNYGSASKGILQLFGNFNIDNIFGLNEYYSFGYVTNDKAKHKNFDSYQFQTSIPFGYHNLLMNYNNSSYSTPIFGNNKQYTSLGGSSTLGFSVDSTLHRDNNSKTTSNIGVSIENYSNFIDDYKIEISTYKIRKYQLGIFHQQRFKNSVLGLGLSSSFGHIRDFFVDFGNLQIPAKKFNKFNYDISWMQILPLQLNHITTSFNASLHGQFSPDVLCATEKIVLGGISSIRGFKDGVENTNNGYFVRNELIFGLPPLLPRFQNGFKNMEIFFAYDFGHFNNKPSESVSKGYISGIAAGFRSSKGKGHFDLTFAQAISARGKKSKLPMEIYASMALEI